MQFKNKVFIIAEAGVNHNGDVAMARRLIETAAVVGADAVKFQTFKTENVVSSTAPKAAYQLQTTDAQETQFEMLKKLELSYADHKKLKASSEDQGLFFFSTPFDEESVDLLERLGVLLYKIPSGEITNIPLLEHIAKKQKPMILSTGMSFLGEVDAAINAIRALNTQELVLLHCVSNYPADVADVNLRAMETLKSAFGLPVGFSDHTLGIEVSLAAVALGACIIEKHFTLDKTLPGPDHKASLEPSEFKALVDGIRKVEVCLGDGLKQPRASELDVQRVARKSLVANRPIEKGEEIIPTILSAKRPGTGISPSALKRVCGRRAARCIGQDEIMTERLLS